MAKKKKAKKKVSRGNPPVRMKKRPKGWVRVSAVKISRRNGRTVLLTRPAAKRRRSR